MTPGTRSIDESGLTHHRRRVSLHRHRTPAGISGGGSVILQRRQAYVRSMTVA